MFDIQNYAQAASVEDAIRLLGRDERAVVISGGSDVLIKIREGKLAGCSLVSIHGLEELTGVSMDADGSVVICPATSFAGVAESQVIREHVPTLGYACDQAGGPQLRHVGTIGGNICNGVTSADSAPSLLTLNAELVIQGPDGRRRVKHADFYAGPGRVCMAHDELLVQIRVAKADYDGYSGHYIKYAMRDAMDIATLGCAVHVRLDGNRVADARLAFGVAAPTPVRCPLAEAAIQGQPATEGLLKRFGEVAATEVSPRTSWRASREFRLQLVRELSARALRQAIINGGGVVA